MLNNIDLVVLETVTGGASTSNASNAAQQAQFRELAQSHCPATYERYREAPQITRPMGEKCLDEAGLGMFKGRLDRYFPRQ